MTDMLLIGAGLIVVAVIIWGGLSGVNSTPQVNPLGVPTDTGQTAANNGSGAGPSVGQPAPDFTLPDTYSKTYSLSQFKGQVVMLEFMAPWCPHCQADAPMMNDVYNKYKDKGVQVLGVSATNWDRNYETNGPNATPTPISMGDLVWFRDQFQVAYPLLFDPSLQAANNYGIQGYPTVVIVGKDGNIAALPQLPLTLDSLSIDIDNALK
jgi:peroxiredoxin